MVLGFAKYLGGRLVAGAKSIGDAVVRSGVKSVSAIVDSGKAVKDFATKVVTDAADKFRGHFSDDVPGGDDASSRCRSSSASRSSRPTANSSTCCG